MQTSYGTQLFSDRWEMIVINDMKSINPLRWSVIIGNLI